jgi:hypothetical protein
MSLALALIVTAFVETLMGRLTSSSPGMERWVSAFVAPHPKLRMQLSSLPIVSP